MRHDQSVIDEAKNTSAQQKKNTANQARPESDGTGWIFPLLMVIIGLGVLGLIFKSLGLF